MRSTQLLYRLSNKYRRTVAHYLARRPVLLHPPPNGMVSITFDDFPVNALYTAGRILEDHLISATYYTSLGLAGKHGPVGKYYSESDLPVVLQMGHELGCHTFHHCHSWQTAPAEFERSIQLNIERLGEILPAAKFTSHSYPISCPRPGVKLVAGRHYPCSRGGEQRPNPKKCDANNLDTLFIDAKMHDFMWIKAQIDRTMHSGDWLILATHDVSSSPTQFGCTTELFLQIVHYLTAVKVSVLPVSKAFQACTHVR